MASLPTSFGIPRASITYPTSLRVLAPTEFAAEVAGYGVAGAVVVGPAGWTGVGRVGADGSVAFTLYPAGSSASAGPEMVFQFDGACVGCAWGDASAYFPAVAQALPSAGTGPASTPPPGLQTESLGPGLIGYSLAANPGLQTNGVAYTNLPETTSDPVFDDLQVTLPLAEHSLATVLLNAFVAQEDRYLCASGAPSATVSLTLTQGSC